MKFVLSELKIGQSIQGRVVEALADEDFLLSFDGDLIRVHNETRKSLKVGDVVTVMVRAVDPPRFQLVPDRNEQRRKGRLDLSV